MPGRARFNTDWIKPKSPFYDWIEEVPGNIRVARCGKCKTTFQLGNMGESAVASHARAKRLNKAMKNTPSASNNNLMTSFLTVKSTSTAPESSNSADTSAKPDKVSERVSLTIPVPPESQATPTRTIPVPPESKATPTRKMDNFTVKQDTLRAEVIWTMKLVTSHQSYNSSDDMSDLFKDMFHDSEIAKKFQCGSRKASYYAVNTEI